MKKIIIAMAAIAAAFTMTSCNKELVEPENNPTEGNCIITASTESNITKTSLYGNDTDGYEVVWSEGDSFVIGGNTFTLIDGAGTTSGKFQGTLPDGDGPFTAYYPATFNGTDWPTTQAYTKDNITGSPMTAEVEITDGKVSKPLSFKNAGGILRLTVKGHENISVTSIMVNADDLEDITLECAGGVTLDETNGCVFHIAIPEGRYSGTSILLLAEGGMSCIKRLSSKDLVIERSMITPASFSTSFETVGSEEVLSGIFTVGDGNKASFSRGNLYCSGATFNNDGSVQSMDNAHWGFESEQYLSSPSSNGTRDDNHISHFMWRDAAVDAIALKCNDAAVIGLFTDANGFTVNGKSGWRALTHKDLMALLHTRKTSNGTASTVCGQDDARWFKGRIKVSSGTYINGLFLIPDVFTWPEPVKTAPEGTINDASASFSSTSFSLVEFKTLEKAGLVFLPAAGNRDGSNGSSEVSTINVAGYYWLDSLNDAPYSEHLSFEGSGIYPSGQNFSLNYRYYAQSLRLITEAALSINVTASCLYGYVLDWDYNIIKDSQRWNLTYEFDEGDEVRLYDHEVSSIQSLEGINFTTDGISYPAGISKMSVFRGTGGKIGHDYDLIYPVQNTAYFNGEKLIGLDVPSQQQLVSNVKDSEGNFWAASVTLSGESQTCTATNLCGWFTGQVMDNIAKIIIRSNSETDILSSDGDGLDITNSDGSWKLECNGTGEYHNYVCATREKASMGTFVIPLLPCKMEKGFVAEFYFNADDIEPYCVKRFDGKIDLKPGIILDFGKVYHDTECSLLAKFNSHADGYFLEMYGNRQVAYDVPAINNIAVFDRNFSLISPYPFINTPFDLYFYANMADNSKEPKVNGIEAVRTSKNIQYHGITFNEYKIENFKVPLSAADEPFFLVFTNDTETFGVIPLTYLWCDDSPAQSFSSSGYYVLADESRTELIMNSGIPYDYKLITDNPSFEEGMIWKADVKENGEVNLYADKEGERFYLMHQHYRPIAYISSNSAGLDLWGQWSLESDGLCHYSMQKDALYFLTLDPEKSVVLSAQPSAQGTGFYAYELFEVRP